MDAIFIIILYQLTIIKLLHYTKYFNQNKVDNLMNDIEIKIDQLINKSNSITQELEDLKREIGLLKQENLKSQINNVSNINELLEKLPVSVPPHLIANKNDEAEQMERAESIYYILIDKPLQHKKILHYGCEDKYLCEYFATHNPKLSIGYGEKVKEFTGDYTLTNNWNKILENAPYDFILLYDVLDHILDEDPTNIMIKLRQLCTENTLVYVRCHPWCSKHGTHLYEHGLNKAYAHLLFSESELVDMCGSVGKPARKVIHPHNTYDKWFHDANYHIEVRNTKETDIEDIFIHNQEVTQKIRSHWKSSEDHNLNTGRVFPAHQCKQEFVDYILKVN